MGSANIALSSHYFPEPVFTGPVSPAASPGNGNESGVAQIAQPKKIRGVGFGDIFKEGSVKLKARLSSNDSEEKKQDKVLCLPVYIFECISMLVINVLFTRNNSGI